MDNNIEVFAKRLKQARILKKMSMDKLVQLSNGIVSKQAISKYESGKMKPNSSVLISLAMALGVDVDYFFRPFSFDIDEFKVSFRKKSDTSVKDVNALKIQIQDDVERYLEVEEILQKEIVPLPKYIGDTLSTSRQMRDLAIKLRSEWELGIDAIANVYDVLESKGIKVIFTEAPSGFDGVSGIVNCKHYIVVLNKSLGHVERRRFTALHELGHLLYNERMSSNLTLRDKENLCNAFASEMLLPTYTLKQLFAPNEKISFSELRMLQMSYGISIDAIMHKLLELDIISESKYKTFFIRKNSNPQLKKNVEASLFKENVSNRFEALVYSAAAKGLISISKAATLLGSSANTIRKNLSFI